jgi:hypothetical protein
MKLLFKNANEKNYSSDQVATELAAVIEAFIKSGDVSGLSLEVKNDGGTHIGTATQSGAIHLK